MDVFVIEDALLGSSLMASMVLSGTWRNMNHDATAQSFCAGEIRSLGCRPPTLASPPIPRYFPAEELLLSQPRRMKGKRRHPPLEAPRISERCG
jgi:hypothetical protein